MLHNRELTYKARKLRQNMTQEERRLWFDFLKDYSVKFQAQKVIQNFIVDFYCARAKLIIEIDGNQHMSTVKAEQADSIRDDVFRKLGFKVVRFSNLEVIKNFDGVCETINSLVQERL